MAEVTHAHNTRDEIRHDIRGTVEHYRNGTTHVDVTRQACE